MEVDRFAAGTSLHPTDFMNRAEIAFSSGRRWHGVSRDGCGDEGVRCSPPTSVKIKDFDSFSPGRSLGRRSVGGYSNASTKGSASKGIRSSAFSPTPTNFTGICRASATAMTMPPLAVPSSLVRAMAVTPAILENSLA